MISFIVAFKSKQSINVNPLLMITAVSVHCKAKRIIELQGGVCVADGEQSVVTSRRCVKRARVWKGLFTVNQPRALPARAEQMTSMQITTCQDILRPRLTANTPKLLLLLNFTTLRASD